MNGHLVLVWGQPKWEKGVILYQEGLVEFVSQRLIEERTGSSWSMKTG